MIERLDRPAILRGAAVAAVIGAVGGLAGRAVPASSSLVYVLVIVILGGMVLGGYLAGRDQPDLALSAGGVAALLGSGALQILNVAYAAVKGTLGFASIVVVVFIVLISTSLGVMGGYLAFRRAGRLADDGAEGDSNGGSPASASGSNGGRNP